MTKAKVVVLAGPSGAGKSRLAERLADGLGCPVLRLDDFYKDGDDPTLPLIVQGANAGLVDWDHPASWSHDDAVRSLAELCESGSVDVPVYEISRNGRVGARRIELDGATRVVAEGIFAPEVVADCERLGLLAAAYCISQHPLLTFWRRLSRDLREHRKPPLVLLRRGTALLRNQRRVVDNAVAMGCRRATPDQAYAELSRQP